MRTFAIKVLANAQAERHDAVYMDCGHSFAPPFAHQHGVDCDNLLLVRPTSHEQGLAIARDLIMTKEAGLLVYDAGEFSQDLLTTFQKMSAQINSALAGSECALVCLMNNGRHVAPPLSAFAALRLHIERVQWLHKLEDVTGYRARVHILKQKQTGTAQSVDITIHVGDKK